MTEEIFVRYINDDLNDDEREEFEQWLNSNSENKKSFNDFKNFWIIFDKLPAADLPDTLTQWEAIQRKISKSSSISKTNVSDKIFNKSKGHYGQYSSVGQWIVKIAAVLIIASLVVLVDYKTPVNKPDSAQLVTPVEKNEIYTRKVAKGETATVRLADGSYVKINSDSQVKYPRFFEGEERLVELKGEAFFIVESNKNKPFKVKIGDIITEVVGTEFNIKARGSCSYELVVVKGEVKVYKDASVSSNPHSVKRGEMITYNMTRGFSKPRKAENDHLTAWLQNKISFRNTRLEEVLQEIERLYDVNIKLMDSDIKEKRLTGVFEKKSLKETLNAISISLDLNIVYSEHSIIVDKITR